MLTGAWRMVDADYIDGRWKTQARVKGVSREGRHERYRRVHLRFSKVMRLLRRRYSCLACRAANLAGASGIIIHWQRCC